jgi:hypothetical protein
MFYTHKNSTDEAKRLWLETYYYIKDQIDYLVIDSKADDYDLFREFERQRKVKLVTCCRKNRNRSTIRKKMSDFMQGFIKDIFDLDHCRMCGDVNNRWLFAAM